MKHKPQALRRQRPVKGGRDPLPACVISGVRHAVEREAARYGVSKSFVVAVALAHTFGIKEQEDY